MIFTGLDIEATGLEPGDHRIIEIFAGHYNEHGEILDRFETRIDPQRSIPLESQRIHGITSADLIGKPTWEVVAPKFRDFLAGGTKYVAHNGDSYDLPFLNYEFRRVGIGMPKKPSIDTMKDGVWATPDGKKPTLAELCFACGIPYDKALAHAAPYDVHDTMMPAFFAARRWGYFDMMPAAA